MNTYVVYNEKGKILKSVSCPPNKIEANARGNKYIISNVTDSSHYIENDKAVPFPERPSKDHEFDYDIKQWVDTKTDEIRAQEKMQKIRIERNMMLLHSDWTQLPDAQLTAEQKERWRVYRQELRDLPDSTDLTNVEWPIAP